MTILFITHNVSEAVLMSQRVYVMQANPGHVKAEVKIKFNEERSLELQHTKKFINYCNQIEELIGKVDLNDVV